MVEAHGFARRSPASSHEATSAGLPIKQGEGAPNVGLDELLRSQDGTVDMGFGGEMNDGVDFVLARPGLPPIPGCRYPLAQRCSVRHPAGPSGSPGTAGIGQRVRLITRMSGSTRSR